ncbi:MAG: TonB-dependent receptor, partial [Candidatus Latescibacterota bacterium]
NEIIVRGGIPGENLFLLDTIEIPNPNHFGQQGAGGGPISTINTQFVREVNFMAGAFPAKYGDKVSSVMDIALREGSRKRMEGSFDVGMAGAGGLFEGPLSGGKGSYLLSAHKSFLDLVISSWGLTAVPQYYNLQGKVVYDLDDHSKLLVNAIYGSDGITIEEEAEEDASGYVGEEENVRSKSRQYAAGATLRSLWPKGFSDLTISRALNYWDTFVYGLAEDPYYSNKSTEDENTAKFDGVYQFSKAHELSAGVSYKEVHADHNMWADADTVFAWGVVDSASVQLDTLTSVHQAYPVWEDRENVRSDKMAAYAQYKWRPGSGIIVNLGLRYDRFAYTGHAHLGPRLGLSYALTPNTMLNAAYGDHAQSPGYFELTAHPNNRTLDYKRTRQTVLGLEHLFREDTKGTIELYYKEYSHVPVPRSWTTTDPWDSSEGELLSAGKGDARGIEFFLQRKMSGSFQGTLSYSYSKSRSLDLRFNEYYDWDYDYRHVFTAISSYRWKLMHKAWYQLLKEQTVYKLFAWILPFSDETVVSFRWRYLGGRPYTEPNYHREWHTWITGETQKLNTQRHPVYHRLDIRLDRRFMFGGWNMVTYLDIQNVTNRDNIWGVQYKENGGKENVLQFKVFPIGGLVIEF